MNYGDVRKRRDARESRDAARARIRDRRSGDADFLAERETGVGRLASEERLLDGARARARARRLAWRGVRVVVTGRSDARGLRSGPLRQQRLHRRDRHRARARSRDARRRRDAAARTDAARTAAGGRSRALRNGRASCTRPRRSARVDAGIVIASAAVADWRPAHASPQKLKKTGEELAVTMERTPDVLAALGEKKGTTFLVGFAAETDDHEAQRAREARAQASRRDRGQRRARRTRIRNRRERAGRALGQGRAPRLGNRRTKRRSPRACSIR